MARCGCSSSVCTCTIQGSGNVTVSGTGSETNPYVITASGAVIEVEDTVTVNMTLTGSGTIENPYVLSATAAGGSGLDSEAMMDFLGRVTNPAKGLFGTGLITATYDDVNDKITIATTATANATNAFLLERDNHTGSVATIRTTADDISDTAPTEGQLWVARSGIWTPETYHDAAKADITGSIKVFADVSDTSPTGVGTEVLVWDPGTTRYVPTNLELVFASLGADNRLLASQRPKYNPDLVVILEGDAVPADAGAGGVGAVIFSEAAAPSLVPASHGANGGANVVAATGITKATTADINVGDWVCICVGASGEAVTPVTYAVTLAAGAASGGFAAQGTPSIQGTSTQCDWIIGRCTTLIPAGTNVTVKANVNRVELIIGVISVPNLLNPAIDKVSVDGAGGTSSDLTLDSNASGTLAQADEVFLYALVFNSGLPIIRSQEARAGSLLTPLFAQFNASAAGSSRSLRAYYRVVSATTSIQGFVDITSTDGTSGAWSSKGITLKAA